MATSAGYHTIRRIDPLYVVMALSGAFVLTNKMPVLAIAAALATVAIGLSAWFVKGRVKILAICAGPLALLVGLEAYLLASYLASGQPASAILTYEFLKHDGNFFFAYAMFFAFASPYINYRPLFSFYHTLILVVFSAVAALGLLEMVTRTPVLFSHYNMGEFYFTALNNAHNATGSAYAAASVVALAAWLFEDRSPKRRQRYLLFMILCVLGLLITKSRGSLLAFAIAAAFIFYKRYGLRFTTSKRFVAIALMFVIAVVATGAQYRFATIRSGEDFNVISRFSLWAKAAQLIRMSPVTGVGFGRFNDLNLTETIGRPHLDGIPGFAALCTTPKPAYNDAHAHNSYLQFLAETGIVGLGLLLAFWISLFARFRRAASVTEDGNIRFGAVLGMANIILLLSLSATENYMSSTTIMLFMSASVGIALGMIGQARGMEGQKCG